MKIAVLALTEGGILLAKRLAQDLAGALFLPRKENQKTAELLQDNWSLFDGFICIMATGIVVRSIAPLLCDKASDPCVIVMDEKGKNVISLLSGHLGGGNKLTLQTALMLNANPVITTASDTLELVSLDLWAKEKNLRPPERAEMTALTAKLVNRTFLRLYSEMPLKHLPLGLVYTESLDAADIAITHKTIPYFKGSYFRPQNLIIGTGCNRGTPASEFEQALHELFIEHQISPGSIRNIASIDKKNDEIGLLEFAANNNWKIDFFDKESLNTQTHLEVSPAALKAVGAIGVAEPAALLSAQSDQLLCRKRKWKNVTMAVALAPFTL
jgi:cobalt-precorrin 5A hydrolase